MMPEQEDLLKEARNSLSAAKLLHTKGFYRFAASRAYYSMFYIAEAFLPGKGLAFSKHSGVHAGFAEHFVKTGIVPLEYQKYLDEVSHRRKTMVSTGDRSAKIRTYNYPQGRMTDHRINLTIYNLPSILDGNIQEVLDKLQMAENSERLKESNI